MRLVLSASLILLFAIPAAADYKIVIRMRPTIPNLPEWVETRYVQGERQRVENNRSKVYQLYQCDRGQQFWVNPETKLYQRSGFPPKGTLVASGLKANGKNTSRPWIRHYKVTSTQTGKRATVFGYPAWEVRDEVVSTPLDDSGMAFTYVVDHWYIDVRIADCALSDGLGPFIPSASDPYIKVERIGEVRRGFPVLIRRAYGPQVPRREFVIQVTEFSQVDLQPSMFEVPPDYGQALDGTLRVPDTLAARMSRAWDAMWLGLAKAIF